MGRKAIGISIALKKVGVSICNNELHKEKKRNILCFVFSLFIVFYDVFSLAESITK